MSENKFYKGDFLKNRKIIHNKQDIKQDDKK